MSEGGEVPMNTAIVELPTALDNSRILTQEEISSAHSEQLIGSQKLHTYALPEGSVAAAFIPPDLGRISEEEKDKIIHFLKARKDGERYRYEALVVNVLFEQLQIAKKFGLSQDSLYTTFRLDVEGDASMLADHEANLHLRVLDKHVNILMQEGATEDQLVTELSGHIFHESVHNAKGNMADVLFNGNRPVGEITTVTSQMGYYLEKGYTGPRSYDLNRFKNGLKKIQNGESNVLDYDIATCVGISLLLQSLTETYPNLIPDIENMDPFTACESMVTKLSPEDRQRLIPALKKAMANSADKNVLDNKLLEMRQSGVATQAV